MPDATSRRDPPPPTWGDALARLPMEAAPVDAWERVASSLDGVRAAGPTRGRRRTRLAGWLAIAAALVLAVALPWPDGDVPTATTPLAGTTPAAGGVDDAAAVPPTLAELQAESMWLETLLAHARDGSMATGSAAAMGAELEARVAAIDGALAQPGLDPPRAHALWAERVQALQALASFEGTRRWLAVNGEQYDGVLVQVN